MASPRYTLIFAALLVLVAPASMRAQTPATPQISEALSAEFGKLRELTEAQSYATALVSIDRLLGVAPADSYDRILLSQVKAQILLSQGKYADSISPFEEVLRLAERPGYLSAAAQTDTLFLLAQLYQQQASESKDLAVQRKMLASAATYLNRWQARTPNPTPAGQLFAASLYYQQSTLVPEKIDSTLLASSRAAAEAGLPLQLKPPASLYVLILATLQQSEKHLESTDILELLVEQNPANSSYWQQLSATYLALAGAAKNEREADRYNLRALLTLERAQARGFLVSPKENFNVVALYLGLRQFDPAIALLEKGLSDGTLENTRRNWELLANSYQQSQRETEAIAALEKAVVRLPEDGQLEFSLAQLLYGRTRVADARRHLGFAVKKGHLDKPGQTRLFLAYTAFELQDYADAAAKAGEAANFDDVKKDDLVRLKKAIDDALRTRVSATSKS
ncbi:hypothetical protein [Rariglobus hedericola]|uniref:Tetratricopeptide repeat protein n=1 Tax=Rariglobus hedericola TaxID=2597822 RepID=A0A556QNY6_9BACT|nr:hypothetical protein [Rariglobus hedericola]TSJ78339.1 hypothetical protein FPL22_03270 [Rariglobus hedericola]